MAVSKVRARKHKVFRSVFDTHTSFPTPILPATQPSGHFGGPTTISAPIARLDHHHRHVSSATADQVRWDRAWHVVTSRIQLPSSVAVEDSFGALTPETQETDETFISSLALVLDPHDALPHAAYTEDILVWHAQQVRQHFVNHVMPLLSACAGQGGASDVVLSSIRTLEAAHRQYLYGLSLVLRGIGNPSKSNVSVSRFRKDLRATISNSWTPGLQSALRVVLCQLTFDVLCSRRISSDLDADSFINEPRNELLGLVESLQKVGLTGDKFQILFAEVMDSCMRTFIRQKYAGMWTEMGGPAASLTTATSILTGCMADLCDWVENQYGQLSVLVFSRIGIQIEYSEVESWKDIAIGRLVGLRISELFEIVLHWPESKGGVEDLRSAVTTPRRRLQLTDTFSAALQKRLLHPGCSTLYILQTYISMIRTFHALDHSKVLLDRVVHALQLYLRQRDDAIRIVVMGLLSNPKDLDEEESKKRLGELAVILNDPTQQKRRHADVDELDWDDMTWVPDPVDAGVNYKRPKSEDVIGTLISALGSQDIFIKEFQAIIAERLLSSSQSGYQQELKVLGLLKRRFGENALQNCDVMVKDIHDSRRVDVALGRHLGKETATGSEAPSFHSKILSRLFWPSLPKESFKVPLPVAELQEQYEAGFEQLKNARKLNWLDHLGTATVQLDLTDRSVTVECKTYEAAVIYAFQDETDDESASPAQKTFVDLWQHLMIDEDLLEAALAFWVSQRVLKDTGNQTYIVMETLEQEGSAEAGADADATGDEAEADTSQPSPRKAKGVSSQEKERQGVYWQFIVGMLTNSAPSMPLGQILMMMKMLIADGCPWSNEELQEFLDEKVAENQLELVGGKYRLPRK
ncbi:anaphase-promoting complex subunit 2 [Geosmithia morbida]|uniref:Anaphase-promoting complex subunit 2 n=1 Tax=Geosmithia morbida TaxID=1094350 RepID=A0A9P5D3C5_9HYPO|nr:anaphase-promoting complex subunit 2 [Geosmithia morbida]KAF4122401.1 anaphase-promoting complex subunit 2 [Geosmithia morbida]